MRRAAVLLLAVLAILGAGAAEEAKKKQLQDLTEADLGRIEEEWLEGDEVEEEDLPPWKRQPKAPPAGLQLEPGKPVDPQIIEKLQAQQNAGKPQMMFVSLLGDSRAENEKLTGKYQMMLKQTHIETKVYFLEDDKILFTIEDGKYTTDVVNFLKKQADVIQIEVNQRKQLPEHPKEKRESQKQEEKTEEQKERERRIREAQKKLERAKRLGQRRRRSAREEL